MARHTFKDDEERLDCERTIGVLTARQVVRERKPTLTLEQARDIKNGVYAIADLRLNNYRAQDAHADEQTALLAVLRAYQKEGATLTEIMCTHCAKTVIVIDGRLASHLDAFGRECAHSGFKAGTDAEDEEGGELNESE